MNDNNGKENKEHNNDLADNGREYNSGKDGVEFKNEDSNTDTTKLMKHPGVADNRMVEIPGVTK